MEGYVSLPYGYADGLDDGRMVVGVWHQPRVWFNGTAVETDEQLLFVRAILHGGTAFAVGKGGSSAPHDRCWLVCEDGRVLNLGNPFGNYCQGITATPEGLLIVIQRNGTLAERLVVDLHSWAITSRTEFPIPPTVDGFLDVGTDGVAVLTDPVDRDVE